MKLRIAFAVNNNNKFEKKHFGDADKYVIYQWQEEQFFYQSELVNQSKNLDESNLHGSKQKGNSIISVLKEKQVDILVSKQFGRNIKMVNKHFIPVIISTDTVNEACKVLTKNYNWLAEDIQNKNESYKLYDLRSGIIKTKIGN